MCVCVHYLNILCLTQIKYNIYQVWRDKPYDCKSDIWSMGCVVYEMCQLTTPFRANDMDALFKKIQKGTYEPISNNYSSDLASFIAYCLNVCSSKRPNVDNLLNSPQIKKRFYLLSEVSNSSQQNLCYCQKLSITSQDILHAWKLV